MDSQTFFFTWRTTSARKAAPRNLWGKSVAWAIATPLEGGRIRRWILAGPWGSNDRRIRIWEKIEKDGIWTIGAEGKYSIEPLVLPQTIVLGLRLARTRNFFGIDQMSCPPIALNESPRASHVNGVPTVPESIVLEANPRLIAGRFAVTLYHHAMQSSITEGKKYRTIWIFAREKLSCSHFPTRFSPILKGKKYGYAFGDELSFWACREKDRNEKELRAFTCTIVWTERGNFQSRVLFLSTSP